MINKVILLGNVGADPEVRTFEDGNKVARIRMATTERTFNPKTQERGEKTQWHTVTVWRGLAGVVEQYIRKGSQIYIEGKLNYTEWQDATGNKRYGVEVVCDELKMLGGKGGNSQQSGGSYQPQQQQQAPQGQAPQGQYPHQQFAPQYQAPQSQPQSAPVESAGYMSADDDLPF